MTSRNSNLDAMAIYKRQLISALFWAVILAVVWDYFHSGEPRYTSNPLWAKWIVLVVAAFVFVNFWNTFTVCLLLLVSSFSVHGWRAIKHVRRMWRVKFRTPFTVYSSNSSAIRSIRLEWHFLTYASIGACMAAISVYADTLFSDFFIVLSIFSFGHVLNLIAMHGKAPAIAFIGVSTPQNSELQNAAFDRFFLMGISSLMDPATQTHDYSVLRATQSLVRTSAPNDRNWRLSVRDICEVAKVIIIDARAYSDNVDEEVSWIIQSGKIDKTLIVFDKEKISAGDKSLPYRALIDYEDLIFNEEAALIEASLRIQGKSNKVAKNSDGVG